MIDFKESILVDSNRLALFLMLKSNYYENYEGMSKEYSDVFKYKILSEKKNLK